MDLSELNAPILVARHCNCQVLLNYCSQGVELQYADVLYVCIIRVLLFISFNYNLRELQPSELSIINNRKIFRDVVRLMNDFIIICLLRFSVAAF